MKLQQSAIQDTPPAGLVEEVQRLKAYFPYRLCWGAWNPQNREETFQGADYDKRRFNARLRKGWIGFIL